MKYVLTYGIACIETKNGKTELIARAPDVTTDRELAQRLVDNLNKNRLSPKHLTEVVDDLLA